MKEKADKYGTTEVNTGFKLVDLIRRTELNYEIFVGLGKFDELERTDLINAVAKGIKQAEKLKINNLSINFIKVNGLCTGKLLSRRRND